MEEAEIRQWFREDRGDLELYISSIEEYGTGLFVFTFEPSGPRHRIFQYAAFLDLTGKIRAHTFDLIFP